MDTSNGTAAKPVKEPSMLDLIHNQFVAAGSKRPPEKRQKELAKAWSTANSAVEAAEKALETAIEARKVATNAFVREMGRGRVKIGGVTYIPSCSAKGGPLATIYFRREGGGEVTDLGS